MVGRGWVGSNRQLALGNRDLAVTVAKKAIVILAVLRLPMGPRGAGCRRDAKLNANYFLKARNIRSID